MHFIINAIPHISGPDTANQAVVIAALADFHKCLSPEIMTYCPDLSTPKLLSTVILQSPTIGFATAFAPRLHTLSQNSDASSTALLGLFDQAAGKLPYLTKVDLTNDGLIRAVCDKKVLSELLSKVLIAPQRLEYLSVGVPDSHLAGQNRIGDHSRRQRKELRESFDAICAKARNLRSLSVRGKSTTFRVFTENLPRVENLLITSKNERYPMPKFAMLKNFLSATSRIDTLKKLELRSYVPVGGVETADVLLILSENHSRLTHLSLQLPTIEGLAEEQYEHRFENDNDDDDKEEEEEDVEEEIREERESIPNEELRKRVQSRNEALITLSKRCRFLSDISFEVADSTYYAATWNTFFSNLANSLKSIDIEMYDHEIEEPDERDFDDMQYSDDGEESPEGTDDDDVSEKKEKEKFFDESREEADSGLVSAIAKHCGAHLKKLKLTYNHASTKSFEELFDSCTSLEELSLVTISIGDDVITNHLLAGAFKPPSCLCLNDVDNADSVAPIIAIAERINVNLHTLDFRHQNEWMFPEVIHCIAVNCPNLHELSMCLEPDNFDQEDLKSILAEDERKRRAEKGDDDSEDEKEPKKVRKPMRRAPMVKKKLIRPSRLPRGLITDNVLEELLRNCQVLEKLAIENVDGWAVTEKTLENILSFGSPGLKELRFITNRYAGAYADVETVIDVRELAKKLRIEYPFVEIETNTY